MLEENVNVQRGAFDEFISYQMKPPKEIKKRIVTFMDKLTTMNLLKLLIFARGLERSQ